VDVVRILFRSFLKAANDKMTAVYCFHFYFYRVDSDLVERLFANKNFIAVHLVSGQIKKLIIYFMIPEITFLMSEWSAHIL
jgi:hypothetical protein